MAGVGLPPLYSFPPPSLFLKNGISPLWKRRSEINTVITSYLTVRWLHNRRPFTSLNPLLFCLFQASDKSSACWPRKRRSNFLFQPIPSFTARQVVRALTILSWTKPASFAGVVAVLYRVHVDRCRMTRCWSMFIAFT